MTLVGRVAVGPATPRKRRWKLRGVLKHARSEQIRVRRDKEYVPRGIDEIVAATSGEGPSSIDDLKAYLLDEIELLQKQLRDAPQDGWRHFWNGAVPKHENDCRDLLVDLLGRGLKSPVLLHAESLMPELKRADVVAVTPTADLPVEVKGQWNSELWDAALSQLDERYTRHWKAKGRGVLLALWFGPEASKVSSGTPTICPHQHRPCS